MAVMSGRFRSLTALNAPLCVAGGVNIVADCVLVISKNLRDTSVTAILNIF